MISKLIQWKNFYRCGFVVFLVNYLGLRLSMSFWPAILMGLGIGAAIAFLEVLFGVPEKAEDLTGPLIPLQETIQEQTRVIREEGTRTRHAINSRGGR